MRSKRAAQNVVWGVFFAILRQPPNNVCMASPNSPTTLRRNLSHACKKGALDNVQSLLNQLGSQHHSENHPAFLNALQNNHLTCAQLVFDVCDPTDKVFVARAVEQAMKIGSEQWVEKLINGCPSVNLTHLLPPICEQGDSKMLQRLLPHSDPNFDKCFALCRAILAGQIDCVRVLLPVTPVEQYDRLLGKAVVVGNRSIATLFIEKATTYGRARALAGASKKNDPEMFNLLYPVTEVAKAVEVMDQYNSKYYVAYSDRTLLAQQIKVDEERKKLEKAVKTIVGKQEAEPALKRKM